MVTRHGQYVVADLSNDHSACYMLTQWQLEQAIRSGGFTLSPHSGRYDLLCTAATDPYIQCGFSRVICLSHLSEFELHHLPNAYLNRTGLTRKTIASRSALFDVLDRKKLPGSELFVTEKPIDTQGWDKDFYEPCRADLLGFIPVGAGRILSVGCGGGDTEAHLVEYGKYVTAIPLDVVIGRLAETRGVRLLPPDLRQPLRRLAMSVLTRLSWQMCSSTCVSHRYFEPTRQVLAAEGRVGRQRAEPRPIRRLVGRVVVRHKKWASFGGIFDDTALQGTSPRLLRGWLKAGDFDPPHIGFDQPPPTSRL